MYLTTFSVLSNLIKTNTMNKLYSICPYCGSKNIHLLSKSVSSAMATSEPIFETLNLVPYAHSTISIFKCYNCGHQCELENKKTESYNTPIQSSIHKKGLKKELYVCMNCGKESLLGATPICTSCGKPLTDQEKVTTSPKRLGQGVQLNALWITFLFVLIGLVVFAYVYWIY